MKDSPIPLINLFSLPSREHVAGVVFDQRHPTKHSPGYDFYRCRHGGCVLAELATSEGLELNLPNSDFPPANVIIARIVPADASPEERDQYLSDVAQVINLNDTGKLARPAAVRWLLLGEGEPPDGYDYPRLPTGTGTDEPAADAVAP
jgi:hypothetical protein